MKLDIIQSRPNLQHRLRVHGESHGHHRLRPVRLQAVGHRRSRGGVAVKFVKQSFMGMELDILTGHPEHDILFIATQVARASGLKIPSQQASRHARIAGHTQSIQFGSIQSVDTLEKPKGVQATSWLFTEAATYQMLLRGHAPQSEPFRKWVTEEVLPSIRKTGKYNAEDSTNPIAVAIMDDLKSLRDEIVSLRQELQAKTSALQLPWFLRSALMKDKQQ